MVFTTAGSAVEKRSIAKAQLQTITFGGVVSGMTTRCVVSDYAGMPKSSTVDTFPGAVRTPTLCGSDAASYTIGTLQPLFGTQLAEECSTTTNLRLRSQHFPPINGEGTFNYEAGWNGPWFPCKNGYQGDVPAGQLTAVMRISVDTAGYQAGVAFTGMINFEPLVDGQDLSTKMPTWTPSAGKASSAFDISGVLPSITAYNEETTNMGYIDIDIVAAALHATQAQHGGGATGFLAAGRGGTWGANDNTIEDSGMKFSLVFTAADKYAKSKPLIISNVVAYGASTLSSGFNINQLKLNSCVGPMVSAVKVGTMGLTRITGNDIEMPFIGQMSTNTAMAFSQTSWNDTVNSGAGTSTGDNKPYVVNNAGEFAGQPTIARFDCVMTGIEWPTQAKFRGGGGAGDGRFQCPNINIFLSPSNSPQETKPYAFFGPDPDAPTGAIAEIGQEGITINFGSFTNSEALPSSINWSTYQPHGAGSALATQMGLFVVGGPINNGAPVGAVPSAFNPALEKLQLAITGTAPGGDGNWQDQFGNYNWFYLNEANDVPYKNGAFLGSAVQDP